MKTTNLKASPLEFDVPVDFQVRTAVIDSEHGETDVVLHCSTYGNKPRRCWTMSIRIESNSRDLLKRGKAEFDQLVHSMKLWQPQDTIEFAGRRATVIRTKRGLVFSPVQIEMEAA